MATFNLVFDESGSADSSHVVYAGLAFESGGSGADSWSEFTRQWRGRLHKHGINYFHANEAFTFGGEWKQFRGRAEDRDALLLSLASLAQQFPRSAHASVVSSSDFKTMPHIKRKTYNNSAFYCAFERGILSAINSDYVLPEDNFNLICDDSEEHAPECLKAYRRFRKNQPEVAKRTGLIGFADDIKITQLQMADMFAYCLRRRACGAEEGVWQMVLDYFIAPELQPEFAAIVITRESGPALLRRRLRFLWRESKFLFRR